MSALKIIGGLIGGFIGVLIVDKTVSIKSPSDESKKDVSENETNINQSSNETNINQSSNETNINQSSNETNNKKVIGNSLEIETQPLQQDNTFPITSFSDILEREIVIGKYDHGTSSPELIPADNSEFFVDFYKHIGR